MLATWLASRGRLPTVIFLHRETLAISGARASIMLAPESVRLRTNAAHGKKGIPDPFTGTRPSYPLAAKSDDTPAMR